MKRTIAEVRRGFDGVDGAGVRLVRVLSSATVKNLDPFLMLDVFDSEDYHDYIKGFPMHPHRGIETITYLSAGSIDHEDTLGNKGTILPGGTQWMTAGSGILHQEMPQKSEQMMGFQLWLNLPAKDKMAPPAYREVNETDMPLHLEEGMKVRVISGEFSGVSGGVQADYVKPQIYFIELAEGAAFSKTLPEDDTAFLYIFRGEVSVEGHHVAQKNGIRLTYGDELEVRASKPATFMYIEGPKLREEVAWGGPIVMNTREELNLAFEEFRNGTFLKENHVAGTETLNK